MKGVNLRKLACIILITVFLVSGLLVLDQAHAVTSVYGSINENTTWTAINSPYYLTGTVTVNNGVTLTIQPGVTVNLGSYSLIINGALSAQGTSNNKIVFLSNGYNSTQTGYFYNSQIIFSSSSLQVGNLLDNAVIYSVTIMVGGSSPTISN